jgi:hypothetical protein
MPKKKMIWVTPVGCDEWYPVYDWEETDSPHDQRWHLPAAVVKEYQEAKARFEAAWEAINNASDEAEGHSRYHPGRHIPTVCTSLGSLHPDMM